MDLKPDYLIILVGINDCFAKKDEDFEEDYRCLLEETLKHGSPELILLERFCFRILRISFPGGSR